METLMEVIKKHEEKIVYFKKEYDTCLELKEWYKNSSVENKEQMLKDIEETMEYWFAKYYTAKSIIRDIKKSLGMGE